MSQLRPWKAICFREFLGMFMSLADAKDAADRRSRHPAARAMTENSITGERWFRGSTGWMQTAAPQRVERAPAPMPMDVDR